MSEIDFCNGELRTASQWLVVVADSLKARFGGKLGLKHSRETVGDKIAENLPA